MPEVNPGNCSYAIEDENWVSDNIGAFSGLTLVAAHTVFIVEPVLNETLEKQAISRIHRIGQTEEVSFDNGDITHKADWNCNN